MDTLEQCLKKGIEEAAPKIMMLTGNHLHISYNKLGIIHITDAGSLLGSDDTPVVGVAMTLMHEPMMKYLMLTIPETRDLIATSIMGKMAAENEAMSNSLFQEIGNVLGTTIANALSVFVARQVTTSPPDAISDMSGSIVSSILSDFEALDDHIILLNIKLLTNATPVDAEIYLFFDHQLTRQILAELQFERTVETNNSHSGGYFYD